MPLAHFFKFSPLWGGEVNVANKSDKLYDIMKDSMSWKNRTNIFIRIEYFLFD